MSADTKPKKKKYIVTAEIITAEGWQSLVVEADSEDEAIELAEHGEGEFYNEEIEILNMGEFRSDGELKE